MNNKTILIRLCVGALFIVPPLIAHADPIPAPLVNLLGIGATAPPAAQADAANCLENRLTEMAKTVYVYQDFADGANNFTQKVWMGENNNDIPSMDEAAASHSGTSGIAARLDLSKYHWGGYMFLNGSLKAGGKNPVANFGTTDSGLDLSGATQLVFYAKGKTGKEQVEFFMGGMGWNGIFKRGEFSDSTRKVRLGPIRLTKKWQQYKIDLAGKDLRRISCGFGWVANDISNPDMKTLKFDVDDIHYEFAEPRHVPIFLPSYAAAALGTNETKLNSFAYLYDNAAAAMALSYAGQQEQARQIADAIVYALGNDRYYPDGRLRNAYAAGDPHSFPAWLSTKGKAFARLPLFYNPSDKGWHEDYYALSSSTGNLAWAIMALCQIYQHDQEHKDYLEAARKVGDFILTLKDDKGGFCGGYEGWEGKQNKATYKSTEHNIDLITAYGLLAKLTGEEKYTEAAAQAKAFVLSMYDAEKHCFYTGTAADGVTVSKEVLPLDSNTWAILALGNEFKDGAKVMAFVEENMATGQGYDFNTDKDGVWFEGTAQVALAYKRIGNIKKYEEIMTYLNANVLPDGSLPAADRDGLTSGFMVSGTDIAWTYGKRSHLGATAWLALAQMDRNPFQIGE